jgi:two-component system, OmpR family, response regulator
MKNLPRILLVDDEQDFLETTSKRLKRRGLTVATARDCQEALAVIEENPPEVVVLDLVLRENSGLACLEKIKRYWPAIAVIFLTGHTSLRAATECIEQGAADYCLKPVELEELLEKIQIASRQ